MILIRLTKRIQACKLETLFYDARDANPIRLAAVRVYSTQPPNYAEHTTCSPRPVATPQYNSRRRRNQSRFHPPPMHLFILSLHPHHITPVKKYEQPLDAQDYLHLLSKFIQESYRILANGGRICINVATTEHSPNRFYTGADIHLTYAQKTIHSLTTMPQYSQSQI